MVRKTTRRALLAAAPGLALAALAGCGTSQVRGPIVPADSGPDPQRPLTVIYIGAKNCGYCLEWEDETERQFLASEERKRVTYRRLIFASFRDLTSDRVWPNDLIWVRDRLGIRRGTPRYIVTREQEILLTTYGTTAWTFDVLPLVRSRVSRTRA